jgi:hypothetical protein
MPKFKETFELQVNSLYDLTLQKIVEQMNLEEKKLSLNHCNGLYWVVNYNRDCDKARELTNKVIK